MIEEKMITLFLIVGFAPLFKRNEATSTLPLKQAE